MNNRRDEYSNVISYLAFINLEKGIDIPGKVDINDVVGLIRNIVLKLDEEPAYRTMNVLVAMHLLMRIEEACVKLERS